MIGEKQKMKSRLLIIFLGLFLIPQASFSSLIYQTPQELYNNHNTIVIGEILNSETISQRETLYEIKVIESVKNSQENELISAVGDGINCSQTEMCIVSSIDTVFDIGDTVILYLNYKLDNFKISPYSRVISPDENYVVSEFASPNWYSPYGSFLIVGVIPGISIGLFVLVRRKRK